MDHRTLIGRPALFLLVVILAGLLLAACGSGDSEPEAPLPTATQPAAPTATTVPPPTEGPNGDTGGNGEVDLVALGEEVFQRSAGGIGCQTCHGEDASGGIAPSIIGRNQAEIIGALSRVDAMAFISITAQDVEAIEAYLISIGPAGETE